MGKLSEEIEETPQQKHCDLFDLGIFRILRDTNYKVCATNLK